MPLPLDDPDYTLQWPVDVFRDEFGTLLAQGNLVVLERLFREAFTGQQLADLVARDRSDDDPWGDHHATVRELNSRLDEVREAVQPKPYYHQRSGTPGSSQSPRLDLAQPAFTRLINNLDQTGYFDQAFGKDCVDNPRDDPSLVLEERLDVQGLWPLRGANFGEEIFYSLIEVFHDLVARPRTVAYFHNWLECGEHYDTYGTKPGRALYIARVNSILERNQISLHLAPDGEDAGRLVVATDEARDDLLERSIRTVDTDADAVRHAITLFRSRGATRPEKRSAVVALAGVLESERKLLKTDLLSQDEGALFQIANQFAIRHQNAKQRPDYDDAYLNWLFWWFLATVDLVRSLRLRGPS